MSSDLETLKTEIEEYLKSQDYVVFHGGPRLTDPSQLIHWDVRAYPDYKQFLAVSKRLGLSLVVFHHRKLTRNFIEDTLDQLESVDLPDEECAELQRRLREFQVFEGFTSSVELSFEYGSREYFYAVRSEWYEELLDIAEEIDEYVHGEEDALEGTDGDLGSYFSNN